MANEVTYAANADLRIASILNQFAYKTLRDVTDLRSTCLRVESPAGKGSLSVKIPQVKWDDVMAAPGEVTVTDPTALGDDAVTVTAARQTLLYEPSDEFMISGGNTGAADFGMGLGEAYIRRTTDLIGQVIDGFSATAGSTGVDLTVDDIYDAQFSLQDALNDGTFFCALTRNQFNDFQSSLRGEGGAQQWNPATLAALGAKNTQGFQGSWNGIQFVTSNLLQTDGTDDWGAMYTMGAVAILELDVQTLASLIPSNQFMQLAPAGSSMWVEIDRNTTYGSTRFMGAGFFGVALNEDERGVTIRSAD